MALIDRLKERIQTDLSNAELQFIIDEAVADITDYAGPPRNTSAPLVVQRVGNRSLVTLPRTLDTAVATPAPVVEEAWDLTSSWAALTTSQYEVAFNGNALRRIGLNFANWVRVTYVPVDDQAMRDEVTLRLAILSIRYRGLATELVGDVRFSYPEFSQERKHVLYELDGGMVPL
jgi:hypothetical protein